MRDFQYLDRRVKRTKKAFYTAFIELIEQKEYSQITVKDIIELADYSRGTFYTHYRQKDDLVNEIVRFLSKEMTIAYRSSYLNEHAINIQKLENEPYNLLNHFIQFKEFYQALLGENIQIDFREKITNTFIYLYLEDFKIEKNSDENKLDGDVLKRYSAYGLAGLIIDWIKDDFPIGIEEFSLQLVKTFKYSFGTIQIKNNRL